jgi:hypothetical protein
MSAFVDIFVAEDTIPFSIHGQEKIPEILKGSSQNDLIPGFFIMLRVFIKVTPCYFVGSIMADPQAIAAFFKILFIILIIISY